MTDTPSTPAGFPNPPESWTSEVDGVLIIAISSTAAGSSLSDAALAEATAALREVSRGEREVGSILIVGAGPNFCAGGNVRDFASADHRPTFIRQLAEDFHDFVRALHDADRTVVAGVSQWAAGAGMSIVLHSDIAIGGPATKMRPAYAGLGFSPDGGLTWTLPRAIGAARARNVILTDRIVNATEALDWGILSELVDDDAVISTAFDTAKRLAAGPRHGLSATRRLLSDSPTHTLGELLDAEARSISTLSGRPEGIEGVDAFVGKRKPDFSGK